MVDPGGGFMVLAETFRCGKKINPENHSPEKSHPSRFGSTIRLIMFCARVARCDFVRGFGLRGILDRTFAHWRRVRAGRKTSS